MTHLKILEQPSHKLERARFGLRAAVCKRCSARPAGSEHLGAATPRECEARCELFDRLPRLLRLAYCVEPMIGSFDRVMESHLETLAEKGALARGKKRPSPDSRPWFHHKQRIISVLKQLVRG